MPVPGRPLAALAQRDAQPVLLLTETDAPSGASLLSHREETVMMRGRAARTAEEGAGAVMPLWRPAADTPGCDDLGLNR